MPSSWTTPKNWAVNEDLTSTNFNLHIRDNMNAVVRAGGATGLAPTTTAAEIVSSTSELSMRTATAAGNTTGWLIPAGLVGSDRLLKLIAHGDMLQNLAGTLRLRIYLRDGAGVNTLLWDDTTTAANFSAVRQPWELEINVAALGAATSQIMWGRLLMTRPFLSAPTAGIGRVSFESNDLLNGGVFADDTASSSDLSAARYLDVTGQWSVSSASLAWRLKYATLVVL